MFGLFFPGETRQWILSPVEALMSGLFCSSLLWLAGALYKKFRKQDGMGLGDVKMVGMIGTFFGLMPALFVLLVGNILGSVVGLLFIFFAKKEAATYEIPLGSFLGIAALWVAFFGKYS